MSEIVKAQRLNLLLQYVKVHLLWDSRSRVNMPRGWRRTRASSWQSYATAVDPGSHSRFHPTQKHFHASNCLRETAYVRPVICARLKNSPAIFTDFIRTSPRGSPGKQQALERKTTVRVILFIQSLLHRESQLLYINNIRGQKMQLATSASFKGLFFNGGYTPYGVFLAVLRNMI